MPLNTLPFPVDANGVPYYDNKDANNFLTMPVEQYIRNGSNLFVPVSATNPQPTLDATVKAVLDSILAKILAAPATEAKQTALNALIGEVQASPTANTLLARVKNLETKIDAIIAGTSTAKVQVSGSNVEQTLNAALPTKANLIGISDGTKIQAMKGSYEHVMLASTARTSPSSSPTFINTNAKGLIVFFKVTENPGNGETLTVQIDGMTTASGYRVLYSSPALPATNTNYVFILYPGAVMTVASAGVYVQAIPIPAQYLAYVAHSGSSSWTYSMTACLIP